jgi:hypothetical protein
MGGPSGRDLNLADLAVVVGRVSLFLPPPYRQPLKDILDTFANKLIILKGMLILSEVKVCYAQRAHVDKPDEKLPAKRLYKEEELRNFNNMASTLPYPLVIWLQSIDNAVDGKQIITPLLAEIAGNENCSGAATFAPRQLLPLLKLLRAGVPDAEDVHHWPST